MKNDLNLKQTISSLEIAEMMETDHKTVLRKLDGHKGRKGYMEILNEHQMAPVDFFIKSTYLDAKGETRPCYQITRLGCDFLANKFTGEKGILFTAKYVRRFHEMAQGQIDYPLNPAIASSVADLGGVTERIMKNQGSAPYKIAEVFKNQCEQFGINLPDDFVITPVFAQTSFLSLVE